MERRFFVLVVLNILLICVNCERVHKNAYATMMYMGTPRDYEFFVAIRVMLKSLEKLNVDADLVVIASMDVPLHWVRTFEEEDGAKVMRVKNIHNPYIQKQNFNLRFMNTLNKLYAWKLVNYERVVMLDADNLFLQKTDELFQCGQFCAVFINPCIFHTGLFVLQPSLDVFNDMIHGMEVGRSSSDCADQGFIRGHFLDLLDRPMYHPPPNGTLAGTYRLPLGYQMDASYYYFKLRWNVPCGPNSVITFPGAPLLKPWYWWSWPVLPLGYQWHQHRLHTLGYGAEMRVVLMEAILYLGMMVIVHLARPNLSKLCYRREGKSTFLIQTCFKMIAIWSLLAAYIAPFFLVPHTIHPVMGWGLYLLGAASFCTVVVNAFVLPILPVLVPWLGIMGSLVVMAYPWYYDGIARALSIFGYAFCCAPFLWVSIVKILVSLQVSLDRDAFLPRLAENTLPAGFNKLYQVHIPAAHRRFIAR